MDNLPTEILAMIVDYLSPKEHYNLSMTCSGFKNIYHLVSCVTLTKETMGASNKYPYLKQLCLKNAVPIVYPECGITHLYIDFDQAHRRRNYASYDFTTLYKWINSLELKVLSSNISIGDYYLPLILTKPTLKSVYYEFLTSGAIRFLSPQIENLSIVIVSSNKYIDFSQFKQLKTIYIWGIMTSVIKKSLLTIPNIEKINITLLGIDTEVDLSDVPIGKLDLSGYRGTLEPFSNIKQIDKIVFPPQIKTEDLKLFKKGNYRIASFDAIGYGIIDRSDNYTDIDALIENLDIEDTLKTIRGY